MQTTLNLDLKLFWLGLAYIANKQTALLHKHTHRLKTDQSEMDEQTLQPSFPALQSIHGYASCFLRHISSVHTSGKGELELARGTLLAQLTLTLVLALSTSLGGSSDDVVLVAASLVASVLLLLVNYILFRK